MGRKNGKTALIAALVLVHLVGPEAEINGEIYSAANDRAQAAQVFKFAEQMVQLDPELEQHLNIVSSRKRIVCPSNGSFYEALSAEAKTKHGFSASVVIYDELAQATNSELYDVLTTSIGARAEPLILVISTMTNDPKSIMGELVDDVKKIQSGIVDDPSTIGFIFEVPEDADIWDEKNWYLANPALDDFRSLKEMRRLAEKAKRMPSREAIFRNLYLNQCVNRRVGLFTATEWKKCIHEVDLEAMRSRESFGGLDLSQVRDLTSFVLVSPDAERFSDVHAMFCVPEEKLEIKAEQDRVPYPEWEKSGFIKSTPGTSIRLDIIAQDIANALAEFNVKEIAFDRYRMAELLPWLEHVGLDIEERGTYEYFCNSTGTLFKGFGQGIVSMAPAVDALETVVADGVLRHPNHPVLNWNISNIAVQTDPAGNRKLDKAKSIDRIDGAVALTMANRTAQIYLDKGEGPSVYEERGIRYV